jgi:digeranylgeranylglycerophospholipid reductase
MDFDFDVLVAGAGPAGSLAARDLARAGFRVALFDRSSREKLGKSVVVEVEKDIFGRVGLAPPGEAEIPYHPGRARVFSSRNREAYSVDAMPTTAVRLDRFARRVLSEAERASVSFFGGYAAERLVRNSDRVCGAIFRHANKLEEIRGRLVMDATGFDSALVRTLEPELGFGFSTEPGDVVRAANATYEIDSEEARHAVREGLHADEELRIRLGNLGPYSTEFSYLSIRSNLAYILIGHKEEYQTPPMRELIQEFTRRQGYYRKRLFGGEGWIRVGHILDRLVCSGFMVMGEAACMVIPINGSGVSSALLSGQAAARTAADALRRGRTDTESLWPYAHLFHRSRGAVLASYSAVRLMTEALGVRRIDTLLESGLARPEDLVNANLPRPFSVSPSSVWARLVALATHPGLAVPLLKAAPAVRGLYRHHHHYPKTFEAADFQRWREERLRIFSRLPR